MQYFFDTEFIDTGKIVDLVSIGIVAEDGRKYYAESSEYDPSPAVPWVKENVLAKLWGGKYVKPRKVIAQDIISFVGVRPTFWAYFGAYDWLALSQLCGRDGTMVGNPPTWPHRCSDLAQLRSLCGNVPLLPHPGNEHHALADAEWTKDAYYDLLERFSIKVAPKSS